MRGWCDCLSGEKRKLSAHGPADATANTLKLCSINEQNCLTSLVLSCPGCYKKKPLNGLFLIANLWNKLKLREPPLTPSHHLHINTSSLNFDLL